MGEQSLKCVYVEERHNPLVSLLSEDPANSKFENETRNFPTFSPFSSEKIASKRDDMKERTFDCIKNRQHSLMRCLSKEIFGTEKNVDILKTELLNELSQNTETYIPFIGEDIEISCNGLLEKIKNKRNLPMLTQFLKERIEDDFPCDELLLWLACTYFQTPIYVLRIVEKKTTAESFWTEYAPARTRRRDPAKTTIFASNCIANKTYYITLFETEGRQYQRIVPKFKECNCFLNMPNIQNREDDSTAYPSQQGKY